MPRIPLFQTRIALIQAFLRRYRYDGILLNRVDNYAMATGGRLNGVNMFSDIGANALFVTRDGQPYYVGNNIEAPRQLEEELAGQNCGVIDFLWCEGSPAEAAARRFSGAVVSDDGALGKNVHADLAPLRATLTLEELEKYRALGKRAATAMTAALDAIEPGWTEGDVAARLTAEIAKQRCSAPVVLVAADDRLPRYRHPTPRVAPLLGDPASERPIQRYVMAVAGVQAEGLVCSITRFKRIGDLPPGIADAHARICGVDAAFQEATRIGRSLGDVFADGCRAYEALGFTRDEWRNHHQGGATGYGARTCKGAPGETFPVLDPSWRSELREILGADIPLGAVFAWNPSGPGVKSEDTFILDPDGKQEIVTQTPDLPQVDLARVIGRETSVIKSGIA